MDQNVLLALLSLDAYNRGPNQKLDVQGGSVGNFTAGAVSSVTGDSFFAQAYTSGGQTIIAFRGTDELTDVPNGWFLGPGAYDTPQTEDAARFYQLINGNSIAANPNITLTGHSLGGGLAGFIGSIYGVRSVIFDNLTFEAAASNLYQAVQPGDNFVPTASQTFYLGQTPPQAPQYGPNSIITGYAPSGEVAGILRALGGQTTPIAPLNSGGALGTFDLHSQSLLVILLYGNSDTVWASVRRNVVAELFDQGVATAIGEQPAGTGGSADAADKMRMMIDYSAIDSGATIYGNTGIRSLFHDADMFGQIEQANGVAAYLQNDAVKNAIASILVEYAGLLAINQDTNNDHAAGVIGYDPGNKVWTANFSPDLWTKTATGGPAQILGKQTLIDSVTSFAGGDPQAIQQGVTKLWDGSTDRIIKLIGATKDSDPTLDATGPDGIADQNGNVPDGKGALLIGGTGPDQLIGAKGDNLMIGGGGNDTFTGGTGKDLMFGGSGNDTFILGYGGSDWVDGGGGTDTAKYTGSNDPLTVTLSAADGLNQKGNPIVDVVDNTTNGADYLSSVSTIKLGGGNNTVVVKPLAAGQATTPDITIDLGATATSNDVLDLSQYGSPVYLKDTNGAVELYADPGFAIPLHLAFKNFNTLIMGSSPEDVVVRQADAPNLKLIETGAGNDTISSSDPNVVIDFGNGNDTLVYAGPGSVVNAGSGQDTFYLSDKVLIAGATPQDKIETVSGRQIHGAVGSMNTESPWVGQGDGLWYALDVAGELVIKDAVGHEMFVGGYQGGANVPLSQQTAGILIARAEGWASKLLDLKRPFNSYIDGIFKTGNDIWFTKTGQTNLFNADPLVLDLNGDGLNLTGMSSIAPSFDMFGTNFAVPTGWVQPTDGILVLDKNNNGKIDNVGELFGGQGASGFAALAAYDLNGDGIIDASDAVYSQLRVWQDANGNAVADPGELHTLADLGIASISVAGTAQTGVSVAGNQVTATGTFTRTGGSTGSIGNLTRGCSFYGQPRSSGGTPARWMERRKHGLRCADRPARGDAPRSDLGRMGLG